MRIVIDAFGMIQEIGSHSPAVYVWGGALNIPQAVGGLIFINRIEGAVVLLTVVATLLVAGQIHRRARFSRLIGLCHLPWLLLLPWLLWRLTQGEQEPLFALWIGYVCLTIAVSLLFDALDLWRYLKGKKTYTWAA